MKTETKYKRQFLKLAYSATNSQLQDALSWYDSANNVARIVSDNLAIPIENGAAIVAALSPRMHWSRNIKLAIDYSLGIPINVMTMLKTMADNAREHGIDSLNGSKTRNFALAISGDDSAIVVDTWILKAIKYPKKSITPKQYGIVADAMADCADTIGLAPRDCQALVWIVIRGKAQ
jgi:hypothetical protein